MPQAFIKLCAGGRAKEWYMVGEHHVGNISCLPWNGIALAQRYKLLDGMVSYLCWSLFTLANHNGLI